MKITLNILILAIPLFCIGQSKNPPHFHKENVSILFIPEFQEGRYRSITSPGDIITIGSSYGYRWRSIDFSWFKSDSLTKKFQKEELYIYSDNTTLGSEDQMLKLDKKNSNVFRFINTNKLFLIRINNKSFKTADGSIWNFSTFFSEKESDDNLDYRNKPDNSSTSYVNSDDWY